MRKLLFIIFLAATLNAHAAVFTVTKTADTADGSCDSDCSLREAINAANADPGADSIVLPAGEFRLDLWGPSAPDDPSGGDLDITSSITITGAGTDVTIVDGWQSGDRVFHITGDITVTIAHLNVQNGWATGGAGILFESNTGSLTLDHVYVLRNVSRNGGEGGGIAARGGTLNIVDSTVYGNYTQNTSGAGAGSGGGIALSNGNVATIRRSSINRNTAGPGPGWGFEGGAGIWMVSNTGSLEIENTTISSNYNESNFWWAAGGAGAGILHQGGTLAISSSTLAYNSGSAGSNIFTFSAKVKNTIIAPGGGFWNCWPINFGIISEGNNISSDNTCNLNNLVGGDMIATDPQISYLQFAGGPTETHPLLDSSPALDAGADCPPTDQRGVARPQGARCDIGAFEFEVAGPADSTPPVVTAPLSTPANAAGWNNSPVTVSWSVTDEESQISSKSGCDTVTLTAETPGTTLTCTATNSAGLTTTQSVTIRIDFTAPTANFGAASPAANSSGWNNTDVLLAFEGSDSLSGLASASPSSPLLFSSEGAGQTVSITLTDLAGNSVTVSSPTVNIDKTAPGLDFGSPGPAPNASGWNNTDVAFTFSANDALSGVASISPASPFLFSDEGAGQQVEVTVTDFAGNTAKFSSATVNIDKTAPQISGGSSPAANEAGWNNSDVTVSFGCSDSLSGIASCPVDQVVTSEGAGQSVSGSAVDLAGNVASATVSGINIDKTAPTPSCTASPSMIWPPDHKLKAVSVQVDVNDALSGAGGFTLKSTSSNEPDNGAGDGDTSGDIQEFTIGTADLNGLLRAERSANGAGRIYTLGYEVRDLAGNVANCDAKVSVPRNQK